jgi:hypothetical protein
VRFGFVFSSPPSLPENDGSEKYANPFEKSRSKWEGSKLLGIKLADF